MRFVHSFIHSFPPQQRLWWLAQSTVSVADLLYFANCYVDPCQGGEGQGEWEQREAKQVEASGMVVVVHQRGMCDPTSNVPGPGSEMQVTATSEDDTESPFKRDLFIHSNIITTQYCCIGGQSKLP